MVLLEKEWFIEAPWGRICIVAWGNCLDPPVLVCHGERDSAASWRPLMELLPDKFYYVGMELPGHGRSDPYPAGLPVTMLDLQHSIEVVRRHFRWDQFIYMAHSFAGTLGRLYNAVHPGKMSRVIELDQITPTLRFHLEEFADWFDKSYTHYYEKYHKYNSPKENGPKYTWEEAIDRVNAVRSLTPETARATIERWSEPAGPGLIRFTYDQRMKHILRPPFNSEEIKLMFTTTKTPTLGVIANNSIKRNLFNNTPYLLEDGEGYRVRKVEGKHDVHVVYPERVAPYVSTFLLYGLDGLERKAKL